MSLKLTTIKNVTGVHQAVTVANRQVVLDPYQERLVDEATAEEFFDKCPGLVMSLDDVGGVFEEETTKNQHMWLANITGNPDAPSEVKVKATKDRRWVEQAISNPCKEPRTLSENHNGGMVEYASNGDVSAYNPFPKTLTIPPYKRVKWPREVGAWFLGRDARCEEGFRGKVIESRPPTNFEPDSDWDLDDIRTYLRMIDPTAELGRTEAQLRRNNKGNADVDVETAKIMALRRVFFRLVNKNYRAPPTRKEFETFKTNQKSANEEPVQASI